MLQLLGPTLHDLVFRGKITRDNFVQVLRLLMLLMDVPQWKVAYTWYMQAGH